MVNQSIIQFMSAVAASMLLVTGTHAGDFIPLGDLPGGDTWSFASGISDDGSVVVGWSDTDSGLEAFRWTPSTGMVGLGNLLGDSGRSQATGVSADGSVVVGGSGIAGPSTEAFRWASSTGMVGLGDLAGGSFGSEALGVSPDGNVVVGRGTAPGGISGATAHLEAFRWTASTGMVGLGDLPGGAWFSQANAVSDDGNVVVGTSGSDSGFEAFRWTSASGIVGLGDLPGGRFESIANDVSADGSVIVGNGSNATGAEAILWTSAGGMTGLGYLPGREAESRACGVSADGTVVVGQSQADACGICSSEAFVWTQANGMQSLRDLLIAKGATGLDNWVLREATSISADGNWVVGVGTNPSGFDEAFLADISAPVDTDGDGVPDMEDEFPNDPSETTDTDGDGIGNNADADDDNDGLADELDAWPVGRFVDVDPATHFAFFFIETLERSGVTSGCGNNNYCPNDSVTRAQMAVFLERSMRGSSFAPPAATGTVFLDVGATDFAASFIEQLFADGITSGCGNNNFCPDNPVTRAQMAVFLLRAKFGAGYTPPSAAGQFNDVPLGSFAIEWIEALAAEGITSGCGGGSYCPDNPVTRAQMAVFLVRAFRL